MQADITLGAVGHPGPTELRGSIHGKARPSHRPITTADRFRTMAHWLFDDARLQLADEQVPAAQIMRGAIDCARSLADQFGAQISNPDVIATRKSDLLVDAVVASLMADSLPPRRAQHGTLASKTMTLLSIGPTNLRHDLTVQSYRQLSAPSDTGSTA